MEKKILLGIDEVTLVLSIDKKTIESIDEWQPKAESIISEFSKLANLESFFGLQKSLEDRIPQGYSIAYQYGDNLFYFAVAYHPLHPQMGIIIKFSARSWAVYSQNSHMNIKQFLESVKSKNYTFRLSRIDFTADYQNWDISVNDIYQNYIDKQLEIRNSQDKKNHSSIRALEADGIASTFYVGSKRTGTRLFLRVYDKKQEQIDTRGFRLAEALNTTSWVRFEAVFKGDYAHQLTDIILKTAEGDLKDLIADKITEKYRFYDLKSQKLSDFSVALIEKSNREFTCLRLESPRDNDLISSLLHLVNGSGLFSTMYKCDQIWSGKTSSTLLKYLHQLYTNEYEPSDDVKLWLKKHKSTLESQVFEDEIKMLKVLKINLGNDNNPK